MSNTINTYEDLLEEKKRLQSLLKYQKEVVRQDISKIKEELTPLKAAAHFIGKLTSKDSGNPLVNGTVNTVIDLVVKKLILGRAGWFTKLIVPFVLKNYAVNTIDEKKGTILRKVFSWFGGKKKKEQANNGNNNGKLHPLEEED